MAFSPAKAKSKSTCAVEKVALLLRQPDGSLSVGPRVPLAFDTPAAEVREQLRRKTGMRRFGAEKANGAAGTEVKTEGEWRSAVAAWRRGRERRRLIALRRTMRLLRLRLVVAARRALSLQVASGASAAALPAVATVAGSVLAEAPNPNGAFGVSEVEDCAAHAPGAGVDPAAHVTKALRDEGYEIYNECFGKEF